MEGLATGLSLQCNVGMQTKRGRHKKKKQIILQKEPGHNSSTAPFRSNHKMTATVTMAADSRSFKPPHLPFNEGPGRLRRGPLGGTFHSIPFRHRHSRTNTQNGAPDTESHGDIRPKTRCHGLRLRLCLSPPPTQKADPPPIDMVDFKQYAQRRSRQSASDTVDHRVRRRRLSSHRVA